MRNSNRAVGVIAALLAAGFVAGTVQLFRLRFAAGDVYPPYSSLRADPYGTMALYESLAGIPGATATRHLKPLEQLRANGGVVFYTGVHPGIFRFSNDKQLERFEAVTRNGARLILVFQPQIMPLKLDTVAKELRLDAAIEKRWGVRLAEAEPVKPVEDEEEVFADLPRQTLLYFDQMDKNWTIVRAWGKQATVIMRPLGAGSLALVANGYLLSNEALLEQRDSEMIAGLIDGAAQRYIFDEHHFGIEESGSVAALGRKYGLQGLAAGLLFLSILFVWKNSSSFLPAREPDEKIAMGKSAASGFVSMLQRGVSTGDLASLCVQEWRKSLALGAYYSKEKIERVESAAAGAKSDPLAEYQRISRILAERDIR